MTNISRMTQEFNNISLMKIFEIEVIDNRTEEVEYVIFNLSIHGNVLVAQHEAMNEAEAQSPNISFQSVCLADGFTLDEYLTAIYDDCLEAISNSEFFTLTDN